MRRQWNGPATNRRGKLDEATAANAADKVTEAFLAAKLDSSKSKV